MIAFFVVGKDFFSCGFGWIRVELFLGCQQHHIKHITLISENEW